MAASEYVVSVVELPLSAETVQRMARAVESVDWEEMAKQAFDAYVANQRGPVNDYVDQWVAVTKAIYAASAKHIIAAALETGARE
jgi:hypothetical protein